MHSLAPETDVRAMNVVLDDARFYPAPAVFKALTGSRILAAQKSAAHAAVDDVVPRRVGQGNEG